MSQARQGTHPHPDVARPARPGGGARPGRSAGGRRAWAQVACPPSAVSRATREATYAAIVAPGCGRQQAGVRSFKFLFSFKFRMRDTSFLPEAGTCTHPLGIASVA